MADAAKIRFWLLQHPRAHSLVVQTGKERTPITCKDQSWAKLSQTLEAMGGDRVEALDSDGKLIRATRLADLEDDDEKPATAAGPQTGVVVGVHDAETVRFEQVARLLAAANDRVAEAYRHATEISFAKMVELMNIMARRGESLERSLATTERLLRRQAEDLIADAEEKAAAAAEADGAGGLVTQMVQAAAGSFMKADAPTNGAPTNGKGKPHG